MSTPSTSGSKSTLSTTIKKPGALFGIFFTIDDNSKKAICKICGSSFTVQSQSRKSWDVGSLHTHMRKNIQILK